MTEAETDETDHTGSDRFAKDMERLRDDLEGRFSRHIDAGQPIAAMEARLLARLIELRKFDAAKTWAHEYQGSIDNGL